MTLLDPSQDNTVWLGLDRDVLIDYCPNAPVYMWIRPLDNTKVAISLILFAAFFSIGTAEHWLDPIVPVFAHLYRTQFHFFQSFLVNAQDPHSLQIIGFISFWALLLDFLIAIFVLSSMVYLALRPTHIAATPAGIYLIRGRSALQYKDETSEFFVSTYSRFVPWSDITNIEVLRPSGAQSQQDYLLVFESTNKYLTTTVRLGDMIKPHERKRFIEAITRWAKLDTFGADLAEILAPPSDHSSFTELWLKELSAAPNRERLRPLDPGALVDENKYEIVSKLGIGGQGTVYLAKDVKTNGEVAIKECILPIFPDQRARKKAAKHFENEAKVLSSLNHPGIVKLIDVFIEDHRAYLILERAEGDTLKQLVERRGAVSEEMAIKLALNMCNILEYLHNLSPPMIHRDFTPDNMILGPDDKLKLIDFSVAQEIQSNVTGTIVGKHNYIAPEQFRGKPSVQSDIYSMGATLFFLLIGHDPEAISTSHPQSKNNSISNELDAIVSKATAIDASERYASIEEFKDDLSKLTSGSIKLDLRLRTT